MLTLYDNYLVGSINILPEAIDEICVPGDNEPTINEWIEHPETKFNYTREDLVTVLRDYSDWDDLETCSENVLKTRLLWVMAWDEFER